MPDEEAPGTTSPDSTHDGHSPDHPNDSSNPHDEHSPDHHNDSSNPHDESRPRKRQRVRLSCLECRRRKLSCDRGFPCQRCKKSGTPERCQYEGQDGTVVDAPLAASGSPVLARLGYAHTHSHPHPHPHISRGPTGDPDVVIRDGPRDLDRIRKMEYEIAALKTQLARQAASSSHDSSAAPASTPGTQKDAGETPERHSDERHGSLAANGGSQSQQPDEQKLMEMNHPDGLLNKELRFFRGKEFRTRYFGPANATMAFSELNGLCPFMKETAEEWLKPARLQERKDKRKRQDYQDVKFSMPDSHLESLLPTREETNTLVTCYLDQFEQLHRIVHIPTFIREYGIFWEGTSQRPAAMTALILSMLAVSSSLDTKTSVRFIGMISTARHSAGRWIEAVERWHSEQSYKHRRLIHYQISCLLYLGKRINTIKKKKFWTGSGSLIQEGIAVGLHRDPTSMNNRISPFNQEMRRRIWATIQEFDMQASFDYGLPTLLSQVHFDVAPPANLDDDQFGEDSGVLPPSRPVKEYTYSSYQHLARQSLPLRLELSRILSGLPGETEYEMVIRYTNDLTQEIDALPSWEAAGSSEAAKKPLLAYTLLHIQLRQYILPLHQPYLKLRKANSKYQYSEIIYYNAARDMVLLHEKLYEQGIRTLNFLREDALTMTINLCSVTMLQPRGSTNMIMINAQHTLKLLQQCIEMKRDRLLRCGNNEPWGFCIMCSALGLLQTHLGLKTASQAKQWASEQFMDLHYKMLANQAPAPPEPGAPAHHGLPAASGAGLQALPYALNMDMSSSAAAAIIAQTWPQASLGINAPASTTSSNEVRTTHSSLSCSHLHPTHSSHKSTRLPPISATASASTLSSSPPALAPVMSCSSSSSSSSFSAASAAAAAAAAATSSSASVCTTISAIASPPNTSSSPLPPMPNSLSLSTSTIPSPPIKTTLSPTPKSNLSSTLSLPDLPLFSPSPDLSSGSASAACSSTPVSSTASGGRDGLSLPPRASQLPRFTSASAIASLATSCGGADCLPSVAGASDGGVSGAEGRGEEGEENPLLRPLVSAQGAGFNADFSLELLGLNFNEIWGDSWNGMNGP